MAPRTARRGRAYGGRQHGVGADRNIPVETPDGKIVGTFAMYYEEPTEPKQSDLELASALTHASIISKH